MNNTLKYPIAEVYLNVKSFNIDKPFDYEIPNFLKGKIKTGSIVKVPFRDRETLAFVIRLKNTSRVKKEDLKQVSELINNKPLLDKGNINLLHWLSLYYLVPVSRTFRLFLPPANDNKGIERSLSDPAVNYEYEEFIYLNEQGYENHKDKINWKRNIAQKRIMDIMLNLKKINKKKLLSESDSSNASLNSLISKNILSKRKTRSRRDQKYLVDSRFFLNKDIELNKEQVRVAEKIIGSINAGEYHNYVIEGVTGSGKTLIYLEIAKVLLSKNKRLLLLTPEIFLTPQLFSRFYDVFKDKVAFYHSNMSSKERLEVWSDSWFGNVDIIIGTRSSIFLPIKDLGCIILDEGHDVSYKESSSVRYNSYEVISRLAKIKKIPTVYGSATPSIEVIYKTKRSDDYTLLKLPHKATPARLDKKIIDLKKIDKNKSHNIISNQLHVEIRKALKNNNKVIIFINRRGFSNFLICKDCGYIPKCKNCNLSYTYHSKDKDNLLCHHCNESMTYTGKCKKCGSKKVSFCGTGIQKVEKDIKRRFPSYPVYRMDSDSATKRRSQSDLLKKFMKEGPSVLIGTQMIAKGLDLEDVTLVGIINCESMLELPDYHMHERVYQNITQVSGRAARKFKDGVVLIQAFNPENKVLKNFLKDNSDGFYSEELSDRKDLLYPPFSKIINIIISGKNEKKVKKSSRNLFAEIMKLTKIEFKALGPAPAPFSKIKNHYRWHIMIKTDNIYRFNNNFKNALESDVIDNEVRIIVDVEPVWVL